MKLIQAGDADPRMSTIDSAYNAVLGVGAYKDTAKVPACTIATLYTSFFHVVALDDAGINSIADMQGRRISVGSAGSSTEGLVDRALEAAGLDPKTDITRDNLSVAESVAAIKDRKIDAFFWIGGLPTAAVTDLVSTSGVKVKFLDTTSILETLREKYGPVYTAFNVPAGTYTGFDADISGIGIGNIVFVNADMSPELVQRTLVEHVERRGLRAEHRGRHPLGGGSWGDSFSADVGRGSVPHCRISRHQLPPGPGDGNHPHPLVLSLWHQRSASARRGRKF